jgi:hypothetical protein
MPTSRILSVVAVVALGGFLVTLEPDEADGPSYSRAALTTAVDAPTDLIGR